jgi:signal transduction histidine kinase
VTSPAPGAQPATVGATSPYGPIAEALDAATRAIAAEPSLDRVLQLIVDRVRPLVGARYAALGIVDRHGAMERFITSGLDEKTVRAIGPSPRGRGLLGLIIRDNRTVRVSDVMSDSRRSGFPPNHPQMHSFLGVPVQVDGKSIGNLYLTEKQGAPEFSEDDEWLVETFARHAGIAMNNARLHDQLRDLAIVAERERISQDLHDGIIQSLYAVSLTLEDIPDRIVEDPEDARVRVDHAIESIHGTIRDIRNFIVGLGPEILEGSSVVGALAALAEEVRATNLVDVQLELAPTDGLDPERTTQLMHMAREALSNVVRHADATRVRIALETRDRMLVLRIVDNGHGFDVTRIPLRGHRGVTNMRGRAESLGGTLEIESGSSGTQVTIRLPVSGADPHTRDRRHRENPRARPRCPTMDTGEPARRRSREPDGLMKRQSRGNA